MIVLAVFAAVCEVVTLHVARRELESVRAHGQRLRKTREMSPVVRMMATNVDGVNALDLDTALRELADQWTPGTLAINAVKWIAPLGVALGLAAAIVGVA